MNKLLSLLAIFLCTVLPAQDIAGRWITVDDNTEERKSVVEINVTNGVAAGRVIDLTDKTKLNKVCTACTDDRKNQRIIGMEFLRGMVRNGDHWTGGTVLDPENGKQYSCKIWIEDGNLKLRGYVGFFYRTQTWVREAR